MNRPRPRPPYLPCQHFCNLPELTNRRHWYCQKMNEDAWGNQRQPLLAMLFRIRYVHDTCMKVFVALDTWHVHAMYVLASIIHILPDIKIQHSQKWLSPTPWSIFIHFSDNALCLLVLANCKSADKVDLEVKVIMAWPRWVISERQQAEAHLRCGNERKHSDLSGNKQN